MVHWRAILVQPDIPSEQGTGDVRRRAGLAQRRPALVARHAMAARGDEDEHHVVARFEIGHPLADFLDHARGLVTEHHRQRARPRAIDHREIGMAKPVIKVEPPGGDKFRGSPGAIQWNRGKKSVVLDLKSAHGGEQARDLAMISDVVVESFRPGVAERLNIDYGTLAVDHPELVYASLTGFGENGPYAQYKGYDAIVAAKSGRMMMFAGQNPREGPNYVVVQGAYHSAATALIRGITAALYVREKTGRGQRVETSILKTITTYDHVS